MINKGRRKLYDMRKVIKEEFSRAFWNRGVAISLIIGCIISMMQVIRHQIPWHYNIDIGREYEKIKICAFPTAFECWMVGGDYGMESFIFFIVYPILAGLPFGVSYFGDRETGFLRQIYMRVSRKEYLTAKYITTFITGGVIVIVPVVLNIMYGLVLFPNHLPQMVLSNGRLYAYNLFYEVYFTNAMAYALIFLCIDFVFGGIWACTALASSFISDYKVVIAVCPFFIQLIIHVVCTMLDKIDCSTVFMLQAGWGIRNMWVFIGCVFIGIALPFTIFMRKGLKENIL